MKSRIEGGFAIVCAVSMLGLAVPQASAATFNTATVSCLPVSAPQAEIRHLEPDATGKAGVSTQPTLNRTRFVVCAVPRAPLPMDATVGQFLVTGSSADTQAVTSCTLSSYSVDGILLGSGSVASSAPHYSHLIELPAAQLPSGSYVSLVCQLPANGRGVLESVVAIAPVTRFALPSSINLHAAQCQTRSFNDAVIYSAVGVGTSATATDGFIICPILRSPLNSGETASTFNIDGDNLNGASTSCTFTAYEPGGMLPTGTVSFTETAAHYHRVQSLPASMLGPRSYLFLSCSLPGHGNGTLRGVVAVRRTRVTIPG